MVVSLSLYFLPTISSSSSLSLSMKIITSSNIQWTKKRTLAEIKKWTLFFLLSHFCSPGKTLFSASHSVFASLSPFSSLILFYYIYIRHLLLPQLFHTALLVFKHINPSLSTSVFFITNKIVSILPVSSFFFFIFPSSLSSFSSFPPMRLLFLSFSFSLLQHFPSSPPRESHLLQNFPFSYWKSVVLYVCTFF